MAPHQACSRSRSGLLAGIESQGHQICFVKGQIGTLDLLPQQAAMASSVIVAQSMRRKKGGRKMEVAGRNEVAARPTSAPLWTGWLVVEFWRWLSRPLVALGSDAEGSIERLSSRVTLKILLVFFFEDYMCFLCGHVIRLPAAPCTFNSTIYLTELCDVSLHITPM
ncbi:hypothetical protein PVAP13_3NG215971 [Panicum virgatum]|uniref:Uncharacterized protein n=1 Tax=Panicum virgatum TaxID=38727 RepID=A0A8T0UCX6_PANVG|nr:hypothetical protein PVAP13_3NG215971 [Panicum virgatum]